MELLNGQIVLAKLITGEIIIGKFNIKSRDIEESYVVSVVQVQRGLSVNISPHFSILYDKPITVEKKFVMVLIDTVDENLYNAYVEKSSGLIMPKLSDIKKVS
jgi:hypothetical protein